MNQVISKSGRKELQKCKATMLTERERHGMAELLGRMDPADLISLAQVAQFVGQKFLLLPHARKSLRL